MIILEMILATTLLLFALTLIGKIIFTDFQLLKYFSQKVSHIGSMINCCRMQLGKDKKDQISKPCPKAFLQGNHTGKIDLTLSGRTCHVSWEQGDNHGVYRLEI